MIRYWSYQVAAQPVVSDDAKDETPKAENSPIAPTEPERERPQRRIRILRRKLYFVLAVTLSLAALGWWQWQRAWRELEAPAAGEEAQSGAPVRLSPEIMEARTVYKVNPVYPETARAAGTQGLVVLDALIGADGTVKHLRPVAGPDVLAQSAQDAVQSWRFEPYSPDGKAVEVATTIAIEFRLN
jgi:TonB family protein